MSAEKKRTIGFICPKCKNSVVVERSVFSLSAAPTRITCPCGGSELRIDYQGDRFVIEAPCFACGGNHKAHCPSKAFISEKALAFSCNKTGLYSCCIGEYDSVLKTLTNMEKALDKINSNKQLDYKGTFINDVVMQEMLEELKEKAEKGNISCTCGSKKWRLQVHYASIELDCAECGGQLRLDAVNIDDLNDLCCKDKLLIKGAC